MVHVRSSSLTRLTIRGRTAYSMLLAMVSVLLVPMTLVVGAPAARADDVFTRPADGVWRVSGHGFGHGRGLSQWGSYGAAVAGVPWDQILSTYYPGTTRTTYPNNLIRVRLTVDSTQLRVSSSVGLVAVGADGVVTALPPNATQWRLVPTATGQRLEALTDAWRPFPLSGTTDIRSWVRFENSAKVLRLWRSGGTSVDYRGMAYGYAAAGFISTVLHLPLEDYLRGVVPRESPAAWPTEALRAQTVAARSYGVAAQLRPASSASDICDTTSCQVFGGTTSYSTSGAATALEYASTNASIADTAGVVLTYQGGIAFTEFSASNGGWSTTGSKPYLVAKADPWSGLAPGDSVDTWSGVLRASDLEAQYPQIGTLTQLVVTQRDGNGDWGGRVLSARIDGTAGSVQVTGGAIMRARPFPANSDGLRSNWFSLGSTLPFGNLDGTTWTGNALRVTGWTIDPDTADPINIHVYLDGVNVRQATANTPRPDVAAYYPAYGPNHGYDLSLNAAPGTHQVCTYAINTGAGAVNPQLGCRTITVP